MADQHPLERRPGSTLRVVEGIRRGIKTGRYVPGQRLVETDLRLEYETGRGPIREALRRLEAEGIVEITAHRGAAVRRMTRDDALEMMIARSILEGGTARVAAERIDVAPNRARIERQLQESERLAASGDGLGYVDANERFHFAIADIAGNHLLGTLIDQMQIYTYRILYAQFLSPERMHVSNEQHREIARAILAADAEAADTAMRTHILDTGRSILALSPPLFR